MSLKDQILQAEDCKADSLEIPEWDCTVHIRQLSADEIDSWQNETYDLNGKDVKINRDNIRCRLLVRCLVDEQGERVFQDHEANLLGAKNSKVIDRIYKAVEKLNAVTAEEVESLAKNSSAGQTGDSL